MSDLIRREDAFSKFEKACTCDFVDKNGMKQGEIKTALTWEGIKKILEDIPSAESEPLTDKEQRIFLASMGREEEVCKKVDRKYVKEPYEDSLMSVCREIKRKVKGALWT